MYGTADASGTERGRREMYCEFYGSLNQAGRTSWILESDAYTYWDGGLGLVGW